MVATMSSPPIFPGSRLPSRPVAEAVSLRSVMEGVFFPTIRNTSLSLLRIFGASASHSAGSPPGLFSLGWLLRTILLIRRRGNFTPRVAGRFGIVPLRSVR